MLKENKMNSILGQKEFIKNQIKILTEPYSIDQFSSLNTPIQLQDTKWVNRLNNSIQFQQKLLFNQQGLLQIHQQLSWFSSKQYLAQLWTSQARWFQYPNLKNSTETEIYKYLEELPSSLPCKDNNLTESYQKQYSLLQIKLKKLKNLKNQLKEYKKLLNELEEITGNKELLKRNLAINHSPIFEELEQSRQLVTHMKNKNLLSSYTLSKDKLTNEDISKESGSLNKPKLKSLILKNL